MEGKLQELTQKIFEEGVERAKGEGKKIIENADSQAVKIVEDAKKSAVIIIENAKKEAEQLKIKTESELKMASSQAVSTLKQAIENLLITSSITPGLKESFRDTDFIKDVIREVLTKWSGVSAELNITFSDKMKNDMTEFFKAKSAELMKDGSLNLSFDTRMNGGFKIGPKDNSFVISFTEKEFNEYFQSFLKLKTKEILFGAK